MRATPSILDPFPEIDNLHVLVEKELKTADWFDQTQTLTNKNNLPEKLSCNQRHCHDGGIPIANIIREMIRSQKTHYKNNHYCQGHQGLPNGRTSSQLCMTGWILTIDMTFKPAT